ncbi:MAG TPA: cupin domain-containing protein [Steroidobacteraceae bacterium]
MNGPLRPAPPVERFGVFDVQQVTRGTLLESRVAADLVTVASHSTSEVHRHNRSETVLYIWAGAGRVLVGEEWFDVRAGDRVLIGKGVFHGLATGDQSLEFLSVQSPPILDESTGQLDLEPR